MQLSKCILHVCAAIVCICARVRAHNRSSYVGSLQDEIIY